MSPASYRTAPPRVVAPPTLGHGPRRTKSATWGPWAVVVLTARR
ncbi:hypothetical protein [Ornithinimicrobium kibberense]